MVSRYFTHTKHLPDSPKSPAFEKGLYSDSERQYVLLFSAYANEIARL